MPSSLHLAMAQMVRDLERHDSAESLLATVTNAVIDTIDVADLCAVTLVENKKFSSVAVSSAAAADIENIQLAAGEGPCLQAASHWIGHIERVDNYTTETRWPTFTAAIVSNTKVRSSLAFQLFRSTTTMGALNLHSYTPHAFTDEHEETALVIATHAAQALFTTRREHQFSSALASRDSIGQAKGIIMERFNIDAIQAWELLRHLSQDTNITVAQLATQLIAVDHPPTAGPDSGT